MIPQTEARTAHGLDRTRLHADASGERTSLAPEAPRGGPPMGSAMPAFKSGSRVPAGRDLMLITLKHDRSAAVARATIDSACA
jgi:hypothetical protein